MVKWSQKHKEIFQIITADGETFDLSTGSDVGNWVIESSGFGMPSIDYIAQQGPFQHGETVRDFRLKPRVVTLSLRQQGCDRDDYWAKRNTLLNALRPNRDPIGLSGSWVGRSQYQLNDQRNIYSLCVFNNRLFGGTHAYGAVDGGKLFRWDDADRWVEVADELNNQDFILSMVVFDDGGGTDELYGGTLSQGRLFKWNGTDAWTQVCAQLVATGIWDMVVFDDGVIGETIFAGTQILGNLYYYNIGGGAWGQAAPQLNAETIIYSVAIYDDGTGSGERLYGGTYPNGNLFRYNPAGGPPGTWVQVCAQLGAEQAIYSLCVYNGKLYGGTGLNALLYEYDVTGGAWVQVSDDLGASACYALKVYQGRLYGFDSNGRLLRWNNSDAWEIIAEQYQSEQGLSLEVYNNRLFGGTYNGATLQEYIRRAGETSLPCATLRRLLSNGEIRDLCVYIDNGPVFTPPRTGWDEFGFSEVIRLYAPNPTFYDPEEQESDSFSTSYLLDEDGFYILQEDGSKIELETGGSFDDGTAEECRYIEYTGTWETHPTFIITGPIENPIIRNESTDEYIELDYNIPSGDVVTITLTPGNQSVVDQDGVNLMGIVTPESNMQSFHIAPHPEVEDGMNQICIYGTGTNSNTDFSFTYYNRYIGI